MVDIKGGKMSRTSIKSFIQRHQLISYFVLAYGITWSGILILLAAKGFQFGTLSTPDVLLMFFLMVVGPSTAGLVLTAMLDGRAGFAELWQRLTRWQVDLKWYTVALLTVPVLTLTILLGLSAVVSPMFAPSFQIAGLVIGLLAGGFEEIGWTGFATPRLLNKYSALKAGFILGLLWAFWHILADFSGNISTMGGSWPLWFTVFWLLSLPPYRMLMTWVYAHTKSLLLAQLMHASYTGWLLVLSPANLTPQNLLWQTIFAVSLWILVAGVAIAERQKQRSISFVH